ncbi:hypothetical protein Nepgr_029369 [Nepenthes gracilis]|uniref:Reverse transcriptase Ty1/copia-type domain-containing protein n=1 Tax=Nepenthes gracilis TaxID=150966 RepID=A0AAD3Y5H2_NEPGR|nr:hypothetical protein Nepgr_029369 [Nepenthes gracilis]
MDHEDLIEKILDGVDDEYTHIVDVSDGCDMPIAFDELHEKINNKELSLSLHHSTSSPLPNSANVENFRSNQRHLGNISNNNVVQQKFIQLLANAHRFSLKDLGPLAYFIGVEMIPHSHRLFLSQHQYIKDLLAQTQMTDAKPVATILATAPVLALHSGRVLSDPSRYFTSTSAYFLEPLEAVNCGKNPISWSSKEQQTVACSFTEIEYLYVATTLAEIRWICSLLTKLGIPLSLQLVIYRDNVGAMNICSNPIFHSHVKHVASNYHFIQEQVQSGTLKMADVSFTDQLADTLNEPLLKAQFLLLNDNTGISSQSSILWGHDKRNPSKSR